MANAGDYRNPNVATMRPLCTDEGQLSLEVQCGMLSIPVNTQQRRNSVLGRPDLPPESSHMVAPQLSARIQPGSLSVCFHLVCYNS